jgi:hypothetical protein
MRFRSDRSAHSAFSLLDFSLTFLDSIVSQTVATYLVWRSALIRATWFRPRAALAQTPLLLCLVTAATAAQQETAMNGISSGALPEEPRPQFASQYPAEQISSAEGDASVSGVVLDTSGAAVSGASVSLMKMDRSKQQTVTSGANGEFTITKLPPGSYLLIVKAKDFEPFTSAEFALAAQQAYEVPRIALSIATAVTEVTVRPTEVIAAEQIKAEEKQRLVGIAPNFYTSYIYDAAPLTTKQKFSLASRDTFDPTSFIGIAIGAGIQQANNSFAGYGQGAAGYGKRYGALFANGRSSDFLSHAVFPSLFHQDPRYYYQGTGSVKSRLMHAASFAFVTRSDSGRTVPNYSYLLGDMCSGALSNLYYPTADRGAGLVFTNAAIGLAGRMGSSILREFFSKRLTTNVPGNGKPSTPGNGKP